MVLELLNWDLSAITPFCILDQLMRRLLMTGLPKSAAVDVQAARSLAETLVTLAVTETTFLTTQPSLVAVSSLITALTRTTAVATAEIAEFVNALLDVSGLGVEEVTKVMLKLEDTILRLRLNTTNHQNTFCNNNNNTSTKIVATKTANTATCVC